MIIDVLYPSGHALVLYGEWKGGMIVGDEGNVICVILDRDCDTPGGMMEKKSAFLGDPRGVYTNRYTGKVLYQPSILDTKLPDWVHEWLADNPEWPHGEHDSNS